MSDAAQIFAEYGTYHRDPRNRLCHEIGIPLIVLGLEALLTKIGPGMLSLGAVVTVLAAGYYSWLGRKTCLPATSLAAILSLVVLLSIGAFIPWQGGAALFAIGWIFQFVGHKYEGKAPAFLTNLLHLLMGPFWVVAVLQRRAPV